MEWILVYLLLACLSYCVFTFMYYPITDLRGILFMAAVFPIAWAMIMVFAVLSIPIWIKNKAKKRKPRKMTCTICPDEDTYKCKECRNKWAIHK